MDTPDKGKRQGCIRHGEDDFLEWRVGSGSTVEIFDIQVNSRRRNGVGRWLINQLIDNLAPGTKLVFAITRADNIIAKQFYEELRFRIVANLWNFYKDKPGIENCVDAVMYGRDI